MLFFVSPIFPCMAAAVVTPPGLVTAAAELVRPCLEGDVAVLVVDVVVVVVVVVGVVLLFGLFTRACGG